MTYRFFCFACLSLFAFTAPCQTATSQYEICFVLKEIFPSFKETEIFKSSCGHFSQSDKFSALKQKKNLGCREAYSKWAQEELFTTKRAPENTVTEEIIQICSQIDGGGKLSSTQVAALTGVVGITGGVIGVGANLQKYKAAKKDTKIADVTIEHRQAQIDTEKSKSDHLKAQTEKVKAQTAKIKAQTRNIKKHTPYHNRRFGG